MKPFIALLAIVTILASCTTSENEMQLTGTVKGLKKGTLILQKVKDTVLVSIDSVKINGVSNFTFNTIVKSPQMHYLYLRLKDGTLIDDRIQFFAEASEITINTTLKNFAVDATITGSVSDTKFKEHGKLMQRYRDGKLDLIQKGFKAAQENNDSLITVLNQRQQKLLYGSYYATVNFAINNNDSEIAPYLALTSIADANKKLLDTVYTSLTPRVKKSYYGNKLKQLLETIE